MTCGDAGEPEVVALRVLVLNHVAVATDTTPGAKPTGPEWLAQFAEALGGEAPDEATITVLLDLAGVAAHASERIAAPIACYLVGRLGVDPAEALARAGAVGGSAT
jgi:hypothetical protein